MPEAPKANHLSTVVQSELFDTDIEKLSAQGDGAGRFSNPPDPPGARASIRAYKTQRGPHLAGVVGFLERQPDK
jgi:hypothetical protein